MQYAKPSQSVCIPFSSKKICKKIVRKYYPYAISNEICNNETFALAIIPINTLVYISTLHSEDNRNQIPKYQKNHDKSLINIIKNKYSDNSMFEHNNSKIKRNQPNTYLVEIKNINLYGFSVNDQNSSEKIYSQHEHLPISHTLFELCKSGYFSTLPKDSYGIFVCERKAPSFQFNIQSVKAMSESFLKENKNYLENANRGLMEEMGFGVKLHNIDISFQTTLYLNKKRKIQNQIISSVRLSNNNTYGLKGKTIRKDMGKIFIKKK